MSQQRTVLLLNASNLITSLTYPYAFVQVSEIADRFDIRVIRRDLFGIPKDQWGEYLQDLLESTRFDMILITLRNTDTIGIDDYFPVAANKNYVKPAYTPLPDEDFQPHYFPIEATKALIETLREVTDLPIAVGGFAFSIMPEKLMKHLRPDYGVLGGPDAFFEHFEGILAGENLGQVANLIYPENGTLSKGLRRFFPPSPRKEYTDDIIADLTAFQFQFYAQQDVTLETSIPIEIARGCPMECTFCSEPWVTGRTVQYRDLGVIEEEIDFLGAHSLNRFFMICGEINAGGSAFIMELADRIIRLNEKRSSGEKVTWYSILKFLAVDKPKQMTQRDWGS